MDINELNEIIDGAIHNVKRMGQHGRFGLSLRTLEAIKEHITHAASRPADGVPASVKQKWPQRLSYPKPDEDGNETGDVGELAYKDGWNACLDEAKRMSGVPMPLKGKKGVVVEEDASAPTSAQAVEDQTHPATSRREEAVKQMIALGYKWDGKTWVPPKPTHVVIVHNSGESFAVPTHVTDLRDFKSGPYVEDPSSSTVCALYSIKRPVR